MELGALILLETTPGDGLACGGGVTFFPNGHFQQRRWVFGRLISDGPPVREAHLYTALLIVTVLLVTVAGVPLFALVLLLAVFDREIPVDIRVVCLDHGHAPSSFGHGLT